MDLAMFGSIASTMDEQNVHIKIRKPYTITKSRGKWSDEEHHKFVEAVKLFHRDWKKIGEYVGSKTVIQIRSHAQKHFLKVQKSGSSEYVPPARAMRKAIYPYPLKSSENASMPLPVIMTFPSGSSYLSPGYTQWEDTSSMIVNTTSNVFMPTWVNRTPFHVVEGASVEACNCSSSCTAGLNIELSTYGTSCQRDQDLLHQSVPNFATVYRFIGGIFDPVTNSDHIKKLKEMNPIDLEIDSICRRIPFISSLVSICGCNIDEQPHYQSVELNI